MMFSIYIHIYVFSFFSLSFFTFMLLLFTNVFCLLNLQKIAKIKPYRFDLLSLYIFWYEGNNFRVYIFSLHPMHALNSMFWAYVIRISNKIGMVIWLGIIILRSPEKGVLWKFWLDPRFSQNPKLKWILKWLSLDRGYFKFYFFTKGESPLIISCHIYLLTRNFVVIFQVMFALPCILFLLNCPVICHY